MNYQNGNIYSNNYGRAISNFLGTCAASPSSQNKERKAAYDFITAIYTKLAENPESFGFKSVSDTSFSAWEKQDKRKEDVKSIRDPIKKIQDMMLSLLNAVDTATIVDSGLSLASEKSPFKKTFINLMEAAGRDSGTNVTYKVASKKDSNSTDCLEMTSFCAKGLKELATITLQACPDEKADTRIAIENGTRLGLFCRCVFEPETPWAVPVFDTLLKADGALILMCKILAEHNYECITFFDNTQLFVEFVKTFGKNPQPIKKAWGNKNHLGIELTFEELRLEPAFLWLRLPFYTDMLNDIENLPDALKNFILESGKNCDGCKYCVQLDKTGKRPLKAIKTKNGMKCPFYPGFNFNWQNLDNEFANKLLSVILFAEEYLSKQ